MASNFGTAFLLLSLCVLSFFAHYSFQIFVLAKIYDNKVAIIIRILFFFKEWTNVEIWRILQNVAKFFTGPSRYCYPFLCPLIDSHPCNLPYLVI